MVEKWTPSNEPGDYDAARVARLRPVKAAVQALGLPLIRFRKIKGILNAIEMQIEDGGDSPEVNRLLLAALRQAIHHQVDERQAQVVLQAVDTFERAEAERWDQVRAGTLPPLVRSPKEQLDDLIAQGYKLLKARQVSAACDRWLEAWKLVKRLTRPELRTTADFDKAYPGLSEFVFNWCQDLETELGNAAVDDAIYNEHRLRYARELLSLFPDEQATLRVNFLRAEGEALWNLGRHAEAEAVFAALVERFPDDPWGYIGWADQYWLFRDSPKDYQRAEAILKRGLARESLNDRKDLLERLEDLYDEWGKLEEKVAIAAQRRQLEAESRSSQRSLAAALPSLWAPCGPSLPAKKLGRNDPCWCGSGKKYKRCHLEADSKASR